MSKKKRQQGLLARIKQPEWSLPIVFLLTLIITYSRWNADKFLFYLSFFVSSVVLGTLLHAFSSSNKVINHYRTLFVAGGLVNGFMVALAAQLLHDREGELIDSNIIRQSTAVFLAVLFFVLIFYRITYEDKSTQKKLFLFKSHHEPLFLVWLFITHSVMVLFALDLNEVLWRTFVPTTNIFFGSNSAITFQFIAYYVVASTLIIPQLLYIIPYTIRGYYYHLPTEHKSLVSKTAISVILTPMIVGITFLLPIWQVIIPLYVAASHFISYKLITSQRTKTCENCGLEMKKNDDIVRCTSCQSKVSSYNLGRFQKVYAPECPKCGTVWKSTERKCHSCGFMILLTCPNCTQTINPLWSECAHCHTSLIPITEVLFGGKESARSAIMVILLRFLVVLVFFGSLFEILILITYFGTRNVLFSSFPPMHIGLLAVNLVVLMAAMYINYHYSTSAHYRPIIQLVTRFIFLPTTWMFLYMIFWLFELALTSLTYFSTTISIVIVVAIAIFGVYHEAKTITSFQPNIRFDPVLTIEGEIH